MIIPYPTKMAACIRRRNLFISRAPAGKALAAAGAIRLIDLRLLETPSW